MVMRQSILLIRPRNTHIILQHRHYASTTPTGHVGSTPSVAFAFDIDGVLTQGPKALPQAKRVLKMLDGNNAFNQKFPYILMTNGGGRPEAERCADLSARLETKIDNTMFMQAHTIMGSPVLPYLGKYKDKPIMVLGGVGDTCRRIANSYGFNNVLIPLDVLAWNKHIWPLYRLTDEENHLARRDFDFASTPIHAIAVFHDPRNWAPDIQVCLDILRYSSKSRAAFVRAEENDGEGVGAGTGADGASQRVSASAAGAAAVGGSGGAASEGKWSVEGPVDEPVELIFCNPDLIWRGAYARSRLGQGGFREALQGVHQALYSTRYPAKQLGKPTPETYAHAEDMLIRRIEALYGEEAARGQDKKNIYMIGDNPESDIAGANSAGWSSILVHTGVYSPEEGPPTHRPTLEARDVEEAVHLAMERVMKW